MNSTAPNRRCSRPLSLAGILLLAVTGIGCNAVDKLVDNLTEPETPTVDRALTLEASTPSVPDGGGEVEFVARVTANGAPEAGTSVTFETTAGEFIDGNTATTNGSGEARRVLSTSEPATVTARVSAGPVVVASSGPVDIQVGGPGAVEFELVVSPDPAETETPTDFDITATAEDGSWATGTLRVEFGDGKQKSIPDFSGQAQVQHTYQEASIFNVRLVLEAAGTEVSESFQLRVKAGGQTVVELSVASEEVAAREPLSFTVRPTTDNGRRASGKVKVDWGDGRSMNLGEIDGTERIEHVYRDPGSYRVVAEITDENKRTSRSSVRVRVLDPISIAGSLSASSTTPVVNTPVSFTFVADRNDGRASSGSVSVNFGDGSSTVASVSNSRATFSHTYTSTGSYNVSAAFDDGEGHQANANLGITVQSVPAPAPPQDPGGGGGGGGDGGDGGGSPNDQLDVSQVVFLHADASSWPVTSTVTGTSISSGQICINHTKQGGWPVVSSIEGNPWIIANVGGTWYAGTYEWLRSGQSCKSMGVPGEYPNIAAAMGPHIKVSPLSTWRPKSGETVYLFVSTPARAGIRSIDERSNIVKVTWP